MNLTNLSIIESLSLLREKKVSATELVSSHIERIEKLDGELGAFLYIDHQGAIKKAEELDRRSDFSNTLSAVPFAIKDSILTSDMPSTAGSKILKGFVSPYNATVVEKIKNAGAIVLGKTNMDEFGMGSSTENSGYQKTLNPWDFARVPGGSGGGSAVAVAADLAVAGLGEDTGGSIRQPAAFTGTVGLKPTYGLVSRYGVVAYASSFDQVGPVTKNVLDSAYLFNIISGPDDNDATSLSYTQDYFSEIDMGELKGLKIGLPKEYFDEGIDRSIAEKVRWVAKHLESIGVEIVEVSLPHSGEALSVYYIIALSEASSNLARYDGIRFGPRAKSSSVVETYLKTRAEGFGAEPKRRIILGTYALSAGYADEFYKRAVAVRQLINQDFLEAFQKVDLLLGPTTPTTAFKFDSNATPLEMYMNDILTVPVNLSGIPALSIPIGLLGNLPVGLQIIGPRLGEKKIFQVAKKIEDMVGFDKLGEPYGIF
jgi:aspartyl-tRNA(Asn)/glutamyl-tRNA(Gln) amidotransferase subunit A